MTQPSPSQPKENKASLLRRLSRRPRSLRILSSKSVAKIDPSIREAMVDALIDNPDPESITRKFGSSVIQVIFGVLWVLAVRVRRLEIRSAQRRDGFGRPLVEPIEFERKPAARAAGRDLRVITDAA